jgi:putative intracellular protease/amidase
MEAGLQGRKVALVATEDAASAGPWRRALEQAGAVVERIGGADDAIAPALDYEAIVLVGAPGGGAADVSRAQFPREVVQLIREMASVEKPVVALGSAVWAIIDADIVRGRRVSAPAALREALEGAGAHPTSEPLVCDDRLWTSAGTEADATRIVASLGGSVTQRTVDRNSEQSFPASDPPPGPSSL